jgi:hypothetical protein
MNRNIQGMLTVAAVGVALSFSFRTAAGQQGTPEPAPAPQANAGTAPQAEDAVTADPGTQVLGQTVIGRPNSGVSLTSAPQVDEVLGIVRPQCGHVIDLLLRNRFRRQVAAEMGSVPAFPHHPAMIGAVPSDLELLEIQLISDGNAEQGPVFQINFRNVGRLPAHDFRISLVGVLGRIDITSPTTTVHVRRLEAGQTASLQIQLPPSAMAITPFGGDPLPFDKLVVALDSFDELIESNELNNVTILKRAEIQAFVVESAPIAEQKPALNTAPSPAPKEETPPSPLDKIDLDELDLDDADEAAVRIRRLP